jgi:hypothetical protein
MGIHIILIDAAEGVIQGLSTNRQNTQQGIHVGMEFFDPLGKFCSAMQKM